MPLPKDKATKYNVIRHFFWAFTALVAGVLASFAAWEMADDFVSYHERDRFEFRVRETVHTITQELHNHEHILLAGAGIFALSDRVAHKEWKAYVESMRLDATHGVQGLGFAPRLTPEEMENHVRQVRAEGFPGYTIRPPGDRGEAVPVMYLEPLNERRRAYLGYDMFSEPDKRAAMERARDTGDPSLVVYTRQDRGQGLLMYAPVYSTGASLNTVGKRRAALEGYVFSVFHAKAFLMRIFPEGLPFTYLQIFDGTGTRRDTLLVDGLESRNAAPDIHRNMTKETVVELGGQPWTFRFTARPALISKVERSLPWIFLGFGLFVSVVFSLLVMAEQRTRDRAAELKRSEASLSATLRSIGEGVIGTDMDERVTVLNLEAERLTGWAQKEALGRHITDIFHVINDAGKGALAFSLKSAVSTGDTVSMGESNVLVSRDGVACAIEAVVAPIRDDLDQLNGVVLIFRDVEEQRKAALMLENEKKRLANIIEGTNAGTWEWNVQTGETVFNERWAQIMGYTLDELVPWTVDTWSRLVHPEDLKISQELLDRHFAGELAYYEHETRMKHKDGSWVWVLDRGKVTSWAGDGKPRFMYGTHQDITARKTMEQDLRKVSFAVENSPAAVVITNARAIIEYVNPKFTWITGYSAEEAVGQNPRVLKSGLHPREFYKEMWKTLSAGKEWRGKLYNRKKNGEFFWEAASISSISNEQGKITHYVAIKEDITSQVEMESILQKTRERLGRTQEIAHLGSWELDLATHELIWSDEVYRIFGLEQRGAHLTYEDFLDLVHPEDRELVGSGYYTSVIRGEGAFEAEHRIVRRSNGEVRWVLEKCSHESEGQGPIIRSVGMVLDITERKLGEIALKEARDAAEAASRAKSDFLASMNHELRTPLNVVIGFSEVLSERMFGELNEKQKKCVENIMDAGKRLLSLINDILDLSRMESGKMDLEPSSVQVKQLLENIRVLIREKIYKHHLKVEIIASDGLYVSADERMLKQIMFNLLSNAVKFTPDGGSIDVWAETVDPRDIHCPVDWDGQDSENGGQWLQVRVSDTGIGIRPEDQGRLFRAFEQLDSGSGRRYLGSGLGLSLCRKFVEMHGGRIWVESEGEGKGSTFLFVIPQRQPKRPKV